MKKRTGWFWYWTIGTIVAVFGMFGIAEAIALSDPQAGDTFTENIRLWIGDYKEIFVAAWAAFAVWFPYHILRGKKEDFHEDEGDGE